MESNRTSKYRTRRPSVPLWRFECCESLKLLMTMKQFVRTSAILPTRTSLKLADGIQRVLTLTSSIELLGRAPFADQGSISSSQNSEPLSRNLPVPGAI